MATNKKFDPALAETVERVLENLMTRFEAAEEQFEYRADLPEISAETEANLLREIESDLDLYYPRTSQQASEGPALTAAQGGNMLVWLRITGTDMLDRIAEFVRPSMLAAAAVRSKSALLDELKNKDGVDEAILRDLSFVPILFEREDRNMNRLVLRYYGPQPIPRVAPRVLVCLNGLTLPVGVTSNLPNSPPELEVSWSGDEVEVSNIGRNESNTIVVELAHVTSPSRG